MKANSRKKSGFSGGILASLDNPVDASFKDICSPITVEPYASDDDCSSGNEETHSHQSNVRESNGSSEATDSTASERRNDNLLPKFIYPTQPQDAADLSVLSCNHSMLLSTPTMDKSNIGRRSTTGLNQPSESIRDGSINQNDEEDDDGMFSDWSAEHISVKDELASSASSQRPKIDKKFGIQKDTLRKRSDPHEDRAKYADELDSGEAENSDDNSGSDQFSSENEFLDSDEDEDDGSEEYMPEDERRHGDDSFITDDSDDELEIDDGLDDEEPEWTRSQRRLDSRSLDYGSRSEDHQNDVDETGKDGLKSEVLEEPSPPFSPDPSKFSPDLRSSPSLMNHDSCHSGNNDSRGEGVPLCDEGEEQAPQHDEHSKNGPQSVEMNKEDDPNVFVLQRDFSPASPVHLQKDNKKGYAKLTSNKEHEKDASVQCEGHEINLRSDNTEDTGCDESLIQKEIFRSKNIDRNKSYYPPSSSSSGEKSVNSSRSKKEENNAERDTGMTTCNNENASIGQARDGCELLSPILCSPWNKKDLASESLAPPKMLSEIASSLNCDDTENMGSLHFAESTNPSKELLMSAGNISTRNKKDQHSAVFYDNDTVDDDQFLPNQSPVTLYESNPELTSAFSWGDGRTPRRTSLSARPPKSAKPSQATEVHDVGNDDTLQSASFARTATGENFSNKSPIPDTATEQVVLSHANPILSDENIEATSSCKIASLKRTTLVSNYDSSEDAEVNDGESFSCEDDETEVEEEDYTTEDDQANADESNDTDSYAEDRQVLHAECSGSRIDDIYKEASGNIASEHTSSDKRGFAEAVVVEDDDTTSEIEVVVVVDDDEDADTATDQSEGDCTKECPTRSMKTSATDATVNYDLQNSLNRQNSITTAVVMMPKNKIDHNGSTHDWKDEKMASAAALFEQLDGSIVLQNISNKQGGKNESRRRQKAGFGIHESNAPTKNDGKSSYRRDRGSLVKRGKWTLGSQIGIGSFGVVRMGMNKETGTLMAVKVIDCDRLIMKDIRREIELLKYLGHHPNVVNYFGAEMDQSLYIFQEWVPGGSITSMLSKFGPFSFPVIRIYLKQVLAGLAYLHNNRILHRDIKGSNILVNDEGIVKLADFGASRQVQELQGGMLMTMTMRGTPYFMAPEVFEERYGYASDIWSVGCVAIQMLTGLPPWKDLGINNPVRLYNHIKRWHGPPPLHWKKFEPYEGEDVLRSFLDKCFLKKPGDRPCALELLKEPFFLERRSELFDEQTATPSSLFSAEDDHSLFGWEQILSPATQRRAHTPSTAGRLRRSKSTGLPRSPFLSPPIPRQCDVKKEVTVVTSPLYDTSDWPSWARENVTSSKKQITESPVIDEASKLMGSLAISDDSSTSAFASLWRRNLFCKNTSSSELSEGSTLIGEGLVGSDRS